MCTGCGAVYHRGKWQWAAKPAGADEARCPACRRTADAFPAGIVTLHCQFAGPRRNDVLGLVHHEERTEKAEHPLNRIMAVTDNAERIEIYTTDIHLPRRLGEALKRAFHGELTIQFDEGGYFVRVDWRPAA